MKEKYSKPSIKVMELENEQLLAGSGPGTSPDPADPGTDNYSKENTFEMPSVNVWEEDEEEK